VPNQIATHCRHCNLHIQSRFDLHLNENENILIAYYSKQTEVYCKEIFYFSEFHAKGDHNIRLTEEMKKDKTGNPKSVLEFKMCLVLLPMHRATQTIHLINWNVDNRNCPLIGVHFK
jgi:hypothetical protein